jgi:ribosome-binding factor A
MGSFRLVRLGEQIREEISKMILSGQIKDPRVSTFLSINRVDVSGDLGYAKVYVSSFMSGRKLRKECGACKVLQALSSPPLEKN